jgi:hypothetical protein
MAISDTETALEVLTQEDQRPLGDWNEAGLPEFALANKQDPSIQVHVLERQLECFGDAHPRCGQQQEEGVHRV